jgi:hypothetical protein
MPATATTVIAASKMTHVEELIKQQKARAQEKTMDMHNATTTTATAILYFNYILPTVVDDRM